MIILLKNHYFNEINNVNGLLMHYKQSQKIITKYIDNIGDLYYENNNGKFKLILIDENKNLNQMLFNLDII